MRGGGDRWVKGADVDTLICVMRAIESSDDEALKNMGLPFTLVDTKEQQGPQVSRQVYGEMVVLSLMTEIPAAYTIGGREVPFPAGSAVLFPQTLRHAIRAQAALACMQPGAALGPRM